VEGVDDPDPTDAGGRLVAARAGLLGKQCVTRERGLDALEDERLGQVVDLGHDVLRGFVVDRTDGTRPRELELARVAGGLDRERELGGEATVGQGSGQGDWQSAWSGIGAAPSFVTTVENWIVAPPWMSGVWISSKSVPSGFPTGSIRQVVAPAVRPPFITETPTVSPPLAA